MSEITLIGIGAMGSALGRALLDNKFDLTVWNRSAEKAHSLVDLGAKATTSLEEAIDASPRIMICITEYEASRELLSQTSIASQLSGKTIIQLSTGTPGEVRKMAYWVNNQNANYLDGSIMVYPETIGKKAAQILISGDENIFRDCEPYINSLAGDVRYVGEKIGAAAALDLAVDVVKDGGFGIGTGSESLQRQFQSSGNNVMQIVGGRSGGNQAVAGSTIGGFSRFSQSKTESGGIG